MNTTGFQKQSEKSGDYFTVLIAIVLVIVLGKMIIDYIDMPDKPVCYDVVNKQSTSGKFNPYYVECSTK